MLTGRGSGDGEGFGVIPVTAHEDGVMQLSEAAVMKLAFQESLSQGGAPDAPNAHAPPAAPPAAPPDGPPSTAAAGERQIGIVMRIDSTRVQVIWHGGPETEAPLEWLHCRDLVVVPAEELVPPPDGAAYGSEGGSYDDEGEGAWPDDEFETVSEEEEGREREREIERFYHVPLQLDHFDKKKPNPCSIFFD